MTKLEIKNVKDKIWKKGDHFLWIYARTCTFFNKCTCQVNLEKEAWKMEVTFQIYFQ